MKLNVHAIKLSVLVFLILLICIYLYTQIYAYINRKSEICNNCPNEIAIKENILQNISERKTETLSEKDMRIKKEIIRSINR